MLYSRAMICDFGRVMMYILNMHVIIAWFGVECESWVFWHTQIGFGQGCIGWHDHSRCHSFPYTLNPMAVLCKLMDFTSTKLAGLLEIVLPTGASGNSQTKLHSSMPHWWMELRSEEHTSELQSPVPISYAVFCLKKKKTKRYMQHTKE